MTARLLTLFLLCWGSSSSTGPENSAPTAHDVPGVDSPEYHSDNGGSASGDSTDVSTGDPREAIERELASLAMEQQAAIVAHETGLRRAKTRASVLRNGLIVSLLASFGICIAIATFEFRRRRRNRLAKTRSFSLSDPSTELGVENQRLQSIGLMAGGVAHDFNNLLVGIMGNAELLRCHDPPAGTDRDSILNELMVCTNKAAELSQRLLIYADGRSCLKRVHDLGAIVRDNQELLQSSIGRNCVLSLEIGPEPLPVLADGTQLEQVLLNLVTNACRASNNHGRVIVRTGINSIRHSELCEQFVFTKRSSGGDFATLEVEDFGHGISDEDLNRMFEPFYSRSPGGLGLGLAIVYEIVTRHEGVIQVASREGFGTLVKVGFPVLVETGQAVDGAGNLKVAESTVSKCDDLGPVVFHPGPATLAAELEFGNGPRSILVEHPGQSPMTTIGDQRTGKIRLLIVEDDSQVITSLSTMFKTEPTFEVKTAKNGLDALTVLRADPDFDCVLLDLAMPVMDGRRFLEQCDLPIPIVAMSGYNTSTLGDQVQDPRIKKFINKPFHREELFRSILATSHSRDK